MAENKRAGAKRKRVERHNAARLERPPTPRSPHQVIRNRVQDVLRVSPGIQEARDAIIYDDSANPEQIEQATQEKVGKSNTNRPSVYVVQSLLEQANTVSARDAEMLAKQRLIGAVTSRVMGDLNVGNLVRNIGERLAETTKPDEAARYKHDLRLITKAFLSPGAVNGLEPLFAELDKRKEPSRVVGRVRMLFGKTPHGTMRKNQINELVQRMGLAFDVAANPMHAQPQPRARWEQNIPWEDDRTTSESIYVQAINGDLFDAVRANAVDKDHLREGIESYGSYTPQDPAGFDPTGPPVRADGTEMSLVEQYFNGNATLATAIAGAVLAAEVIGPMPQGTPVHQGPLHDDKATSVVAAAPAQNPNGLNVNIDGYTDIFRALKQLADAPSNIIDAVTRDLRSHEYVKAYRDATKLKDGVLKDDLLLALAPDAVKQANESGIAADAKYMDKALTHLAESPGAHDVADNLRTQLDAPVSTQSITGS